VEEREMSGHCVISTMILVSSRKKVGFAEKHQVVFHEENTDGRE
jgi:hypothetical protein